VVVVVLLLLLLLLLLVLVLVLLVLQLLLVLVLVLVVVVGMVVRVEAVEEGSKQKCWGGEMGRGKWWKRGFQASMLLYIR